MENSKELKLNLEAIEEIDFNSEEILEEIKKIKERNEKLLEETKADTEKLKLSFEF